MIAVYARVSTTDQAERGYSLADQVRACREYAASRLLTDPIVEYVDVGYSGEYLDRPELDRLREAVRSKTVRAVITYDPDRLSRNLTNQLLVADELEQAGATLLFVTANYDESPEGKLFFQLKGAIAAFEKAKIRERTMRGKRAKARQGKLTHDDRPLGYDYDKATGMYIVNAAEAVIIRAIFELCVTKRCGTRPIARELNLRGYTTKNGKPFYQAAVYRVLTNEMYAGTKWSMKVYDKLIGQHKTQRLVRDSRDWIAIPVPAMIDRQTWEEAQQVLQENKRFAGRNTRNSYLLSHLIRCGVCGAAMTGATYTVHGHVYCYYLCSTRGPTRACGNRRIPVAALDEAVWNYLLTTARHRSEPSSDQSVAADKARCRRLAQVLDRLNQRQAAILKWVGEGVVDIAAADKQLQTLYKDIGLTQSALAELSEALDQDRENDWPTVVFAQRRELLLRSGWIVYARRDAAGQVDWALGTRQPL